jgi:hypothetical protein
MYVLLIAVCFTVVLVCALLLASVMPIGLGWLGITSTQLGIYAWVAMIARKCQQNRLALGILSLVALVLTALSGGLIYVICQALSKIPGSYLIMVWAFWLLYGQVVVALLGSYLGYAVVEGSRRDYRRSQSASGKLTVVLMLSLAVVVVASFYVYAV